MLIYKLQCFLEGHTEDYTKKTTKRHSAYQQSSLASTNMTLAWVHGHLLKLYGLRDHVKCLGLLDSLKNTQF